MRKRLLQSMLLLLVLVTAASALQYGDFTYTVNSPDTNTVTITDYTGSDAVVDIPSTISNKTVSAIGDSAFSGTSSIVNVAIPDSVSSIGDSAFAYCDSLSSITIPINVTSVGIGAFYLSGLTNATLEGLTDIPEFTFAFCADLVSVTIGDCVTNIGPGAFYESGLPWVTIPAGVETIGENAFYSNSDKLNVVYFKGNAPDEYLGAFNWYWYFPYFYYLPGTTGWGINDKLWNPQIITDDGGFGIQTNGFGFNVYLDPVAVGSSLIPVKVEACTNLAEDIWIPVEILENPSRKFSDPNWTNYPNRYYRLSMP